MHRKLCNIEKLQVDKMKKCAHQDAMGKRQIYFANYSQWKSNMQQIREE